MSHFTNPAVTSFCNNFFLSNTFQYHISASSFHRGNIYVKRATSRSLIYHTFAYSISCSSTSHCSSKPGTSAAVVSLISIESLDHGLGAIGFGSIMISSRRNSCILHTSWFSTRSFKNSSIPVRA